MNTIQNSAPRRSLDDIRKEVENSSNTLTDNSGDMLAPEATNIDSGQEPSDVSGTPPSSQPQEVPDEATTVNQNIQNLKQFGNDQVKAFQQAGSDELTQNPIQKFGNVIGDATNGFLNVVGGIADLGYNGSGLSLINPMDKRSLDEKSQAGIVGLNKAVGGVFQLASSPLDMSPLLKKTISTPFEAVNLLASDMIRSAGVDPKSENGQNILNSINNAIGLAVGLKGGIKEGGISEPNLKDVVNEATPTTEPFNATKSGLSSIKSVVSDTWNKLVNNSHQAVTDNMPKEMANHLIDISEYEKDLKTQQIAKLNSSKVDVTQWNNTFDQQMGKVKDFINQNHQNGQISIGDIHGLLNDIQQVTPKILDNPYMPDVNGKISSYFIDQADHQTGGILSQFYDSMKQKIGNTDKSNLQTPISDTPDFGQMTSSVSGQQPSSAPLEAPKAGMMNNLGKAAVATKDFAIAQATGLKPEAMKTIVENPKLTTELQKKGLDTARQETFDTAKNAIDQRKSDLSEAGSIYKSIRDAKHPVELPDNWLKSQIEGMGLKFGEKSKIVAEAGSDVRDKADLSRLQNLYNLYKDKSSLDSNEFLNLRKDLADMANYDKGTTDAIDQAGAKMRSALNESGRSQIPGLGELDKKYAPMVEELNKIKDLIYKKDGSLQNNATNAVNNLFKKGNEERLNNLKQIMPNFDDFAKQVKVTKALEDIEYAKGQKVGDYARKIALGIGSATLNAPLILSSILANPEVVVTMLKKYGEFKNSKPEFVKNLSEKISRGEKPVGPEIDFVKNAIKGVTKAGIIKPGSQDDTEE